MGKCWQPEPKVSQAMSTRGRRWGVVGGGVLLQGVVAEGAGAVGERKLGGH